MRMTQGSIDAFLENQIGNGASKDAIGQRKGFIAFLDRWLPDDQEASKDYISAW